MGLTYERGIYPREEIGHQRHGISMILRIINMRGSRLGAKELTSSLKEIPCLNFSFRILKPTGVRRPDAGCALIKGQNNSDCHYLYELDVKDLLF